MKKIFILLVAVSLVGVAGAQTRKGKTKNNEKDKQALYEEYLNNGKSLYNKEKYNEARTLFLQCIALDTTHGEPYAYLASTEYLISQDITYSLDDIEEYYGEETEEEYAEPQFTEIEDTEATDIDYEAIIDSMLALSNSYSDKALKKLKPEEYELTIKTLCTRALTDSDNYEFISKAYDIVQEHKVLDNCPPFHNVWMLDFSDDMGAFLEYIYSKKIECAENEYCDDYIGVDDKTRVLALIELQKTVLRHTNDNMSLLTSIGQLKYNIGNEYSKLEMLDSAYYYYSIITDDEIRENDLQGHHAWCAFTLYCMNRYKESIDQTVKNILIKEDYAWYYIQMPLNIDYEKDLTDRLMQVSNRFDNDDWLEMMRYLQIQQKYDKSLEVYDKLEKEGRTSPEIKIMQCVGLFYTDRYKETIKRVDELTKEMSDVYSLQYYKCMAQYALGKKKDAYKTAYKFKETFNSYYALIDIEYMDKKFDSVIHHTTSEIEKLMFPTTNQTALAYMMQRAYSYIFTNNTTSAKVDLDVIVHYSKNIDHQAHALVELGRNEEAIDLMNSVRSINERNPRHYKSLTTLYTRMGRTDEALKNLERAFELGYSDFFFLDNTPLLDPIRDTPKYKELVKKYKKTL
ncbi:MAG: tetratricopeptide repeat protein [Bacteroidales bacterium]|nr:tetratricopeptide repeat protein [Bacteroidales bacterium]